MSPFSPVGISKSNSAVRFVGLGLAQVPLHAAGAQHRPGHAQRDAILGIENADALGALHPDAVGGQQLFVFIELGQEIVAELLHVLLEAFVGLVNAAADAERVRRQARATVLLEDLQDLFAIAEAVEQRRDRADIERVRAQPTWWLAMRHSSVRITRMYCARGGASTFSSFSTASQ